MTRPRFHRLSAEQQAAILDAALTEFSTHGYRDASLNRIIDSAGISKGSMYYYFDDKEDLYAHVIRRQLEALVQQGGPIPVPDAQHPDAFWATLADHYLTLMRMLAATPETAALLRGWLVGPAAPALRDAQQDAEQAMLPWLMSTVEAGQQLGAIRTDLPVDLILAVAMGMGQAMDVWLITQPPSDTDLEVWTRTLIDTMRRALQP